MKNFSNSVDIEILKHPKKQFICGTAISLSFALPYESQVHTNNETSTKSHVGNFDANLFVELQMEGPYQFPIVREKFFVL